MRLLTSATVALGISLVLAARTHAQTAVCGDAKLTVQAPDVAWCSLTRAPQLIPSDSARARLRYPQLLWSANVEGEVLIEATIATDGRVDTSSLRVRTSTHGLFSNNVRSALLNWRFEPGELDGKPVRARGLLHFDFSLPSSHRVDTLPVVEVLDRPRATPSGLATGIAWGTPAYAPPAVMDTARVYQLIESIVRQNGGQCLAWSPPTSAGDPPAALMELLRSHDVARLPASKCPGTSAMLHIYGFRAWTRDLYRFTTTVWQGSSGSGATCQASWDAIQSTWIIYCSSRSHIVG